MAKEPVVRPPALSRAEDGTGYAHVPEFSLANRAARGAFVTLGGQGGRILIQVLSVVILARILSPRDYGILAMVTAVVGVADIFRDFGLSTAAIQAKHLSRKQRDNLFWINSFLGLVLSIIIFAAAPLIAALYQQPDVIPVAQALAWMFLLNGIATQYRANLTREMRFARLAIADIIGPAAGLIVAIALAANGAGVWSLVGQQLTQYGVMLLLVAFAGHWLPGSPSLRTPMQGMLRFGGNIVATQLIGYVSSNADSLIIGVRYGAGQLGLYNRAFQLLMTPFNQIRAPISQVAMPVLSKLQDDDRRYAQFLQRGQIALGYTLGIGLAIVAGAAVPVTDIFLGGGKWSSVAPVLSLLAIAAVFHALAFVGYWVYVTRALTKYLVQYSVVSSIIRIVSILVGSQWGIIGVAAGYAIAPALTWPISFWWLSRKTDIPVRQLYYGALRILLVVTLVAVSCRVALVPLASESSWLGLMTACLTACLSVAFLTLVVPVVRRDAVSVIDIARRALRRSTGGQE